MKNIFTWSPHDSNCLARQSLNNISGSFGKTFSVPSFTPISSSDLPVFVKLDGVFFCFRVGRISHQSDTLINFNYCRVQRRRTANVEVKDPRTRLVSNEQQVPESFRNEKRVLFTLSF